ncbi:hypothetical protein KVR01_005090 [Diaporthe batatas]|uniref:uncharacterized protein n=1 Tax=Diaporthe batatas TaxID=748121 RepID=UPI001D0412DF|nr:uncharacterized protein KVR01_005090 [Diaporthe batatas]KAG8164815.1 hypothetical protein KVR01_005090 [Diaporthe batatas]
MDHTAHPKHLTVPVWMPLGVGPPVESEASIASIEDILIPEFITLDADILQSVIESNVTEVPPSDSGNVALAEKRGIIGGVDNRVRWTDRNFPYSPIGRLEFGGGLCSATLVGPRHVQYVLNSGVPIGAPCWEFSDWAILILKDRIGDQRGYFGARVTEDQHLNKNVWYHMGYPGDRDGASQPYRQGEITVSRLNTFSGCPNERRAMIVTDADAQPGQSGGPLWLGPEWDVNGNRYVYGVCSATSDLDTAFSGGSVFTQWVAAARTNYP